MSADDHDADNYPPSMLCPITQGVMVEAVMDPEGNSYSKAAIEEWLRRESTSPVTRTPLRADQLVPNRGLREAIEEKTKQNNPGADAPPIARARPPSPPVQDVAEDAPVGLRTEHRAGAGEATVLLQLQPPGGPGRLPVDVVCVIDTSGSMCSAATVTDGTGTEENDGLSLLDVVKHGVATISNTLNKHDRLSVVSYASNAETLFSLIPMTSGGKEQAVRACGQLRPAGRTNLWDGLRHGLDVLNNGAATRGQRAAILMLLTDGIPNVEPPQGSVKTLQRYLSKNPELHVSINTFGFGYELNSEMLNQLAHFGSGTYAFIPDPGFVGTAFVNAIANNTVTMAREVVVDVRCLGGATVDDGCFGNLDAEVDAGGASARIKLPTLQYQQAKDVVFSVKVPASAAAGAPFVELQANWRYIRTNAAASATAFVGGAGAGSTATLVLAEARAALVDMIWNAIDQARDGDFAEAVAEVKKYIAATKKLPNATNKKSALYGMLEDARGQVMEAVGKKEYYTKWGQHYLPSLANAHMLQICNNFKDPGVQFYGGDLFRDMRTLADDIFCDLPAPTPSRLPALPPAAVLPPAATFARSSSSAYGGSPSARDHHAPAYQASARAPAINMRRYNNQHGGCFLGTCTALMADGGPTATKLVRDVRRGDQLRTAGGGVATVRCVVKTRTGGGGAGPALPQAMAMVALPGGLVITPYHPVRLGGKWAFPKDVAEARPVLCNAYYTFVLDAGHTAFINGVECVTLGHGLDEDVVRHAYFGSQRVVADLAACAGWGSGMVVLTGPCFLRAAATGDICAIDPAAAAAASAEEALPRAGASCGRERQEAEAETGRGRVGTLCAV